MISYDYIKINSDLVRVAILDSKGDSIAIKTNFPSLGVKRIRNFDIVGSESISIKFKFSKDSVIWSDYQELNLINLQSITNLKPNHPFQIEYLVTNISSKTEWIKSIQLEFEFEDQEDPISFSSLPISNHNPYKNKESLVWAANVLNKCFHKGIVPKYIKRKRNEYWIDEDYLNFWWIPIYFNALNITYTRTLKEILFRKDLLKDFLLQKNLLIGRESDLAEMYYLASYYYNEMRVRGTQNILSEKYQLPDHFHNVEVRGELMRYLNLRKQINLELDIVNGSDVGWYIGKSFPGVTDTILTSQFIKGFEYTRNMLSKELYPLKNDQNVISLFNHSLGLNVFQIKANSGISYDSNPKKLIKIIPSFTYEITFLLRTEEHTNLTFGLNIFDENFNDLGRCLRIDNFNIESQFFFRDHSLNNQKFKLFRGTIYGYDQIENKSSKLNVGFGNELKFKNDRVSYICPIVINESGSDIQLSDFKVRIANIALSDFISQENLALLRVDQEIEKRDIETIEKFLFPYDVDLKFENKN